MKLEEQKIARSLRKQGYSLNEIRNKTGFSKTSISFWVRDIELTKDQKKRLTKRGVSKEVVERRRNTRLKNENDRRRSIIHIAKKDFRTISKKELLLIGTALYWGEGTKSNQNQVGFSNSDPKMIRVMTKFFTDVCGAEVRDLRGYIHIHENLNHLKAEKYWSNISGIPLSQFYKTYRKSSKAGQGKRKTLPYGTFDIYICKAALQLKIKGWIENISDILLK